MNRVNSYDTAGRATSSSVVVPEIPGLVGSQLAGTYTTTASFNADGSVNTTGLPATGPIPAETLTTAYTNLTGLPDTLTGTLGSTTATYVTDTQYLQWGTVSAMLFGTHAGKASMASWVRDPGSQRLIGMSLHRQVNPGVTDENTTISYDPAGNITQVASTLPGGVVDNQCFGYDFQQQLTEAWTPNTATCDPGVRSQAALGGPAPYWTSWATNTIGKTSSRTDRTPTKSSTTSYSYPGDSATSSRPHFVTGTSTTGDDPGSASYTADAAGNTVKRPAPGGGEQELVWDELNQLTEVTKNGDMVARMVYDAAGDRLVRQQGDTTTLYVAGSEITLNTATSAVSANRYYTHAGQTVAVRTGASNDTVTTLVADWQGTTHHQITNSTGALTTSWQDPYGNPRGTPPTGWTGERGFVGGTRDATGLTRIGARDYDPILQRFVTVDPIQDLADPLQWNPYLYANNTPITKADPTGLIGMSGPMLIDGIYRSTLYKDKKGKTRFKITMTYAEKNRRAFVKRSRAAKIAVTGAKAGKIGKKRYPDPKEYRAGCLTLYMHGCTGEQVTGPRFFIPATNRDLPWYAQISNFIGGAIVLFGYGGRSAPTAKTERLPQDIAVNPVPPRALGLNRSIGRPSHNEALRADIAALPRGATDIRVNQQQVNAARQRVGLNRPDLQYTLDGRRYYVEYEGPDNPRGASHKARILANDPGANFQLKIVP